MKESFWGIFIITLGVIAIAFIFFFQSLTNASEQSYTLLRETTEAAMYDAIDLGTYRQSGLVRINREKFVENFIRRFAESSTLERSYRIEIYDVSEYPPKVSLKVSSKLTSNVNNVTVDFDVVNRLDAILETPY